MGEVWEATDTSLDRRVAMKCVQAGSHNDPTFIARLKVEARILAKLSHSAIVPIYACVEDRGKVFLVMQLISGRTLSEIVSTSGPRSAVQCIEWFSQATKALSYAHNQGVCHRDLKPSNIMVDQNSNVHLIDFGIALSHDSNMRRS